MLMGTQSNDQGGENRQTQSQGANDPQRKPGNESQRKGPEQSGRMNPDTTRERLASDDEAGGEPDADGELNQSGRSGNKDRERSGSTRSRNP
jgi:hypothetical protein